MIGLLIFLSLLIGKIHGQEVIIPQIINVQFISSVPLNSETQPVIIDPDTNWQVETVQTVLLRPVERAQYVDRSTATVSNHNLSPPTSVRKEMPTLTIRKDPDRMNGSPAHGSPPNGNVVNATQNASNNHQANSDGNARPVTNLQPLPVTNLQPLPVTNLQPLPVPNSQPLPVPDTNRNVTSKDKTPFILPPVLNTTVVNPATNKTSFQPVDKNGTKVTFDERSSFDGDQCPTGYVKVNGKCVQTD